MDLPAQGARLQFQLLQLAPDDHEQRDDEEKPQSVRWHRCAACWHASARGGVTVDADVDQDRIAVEAHDS